MTLARACGVWHPALVTTEMLDALSGHFVSESVRTLIEYGDGWGLPSKADREAIEELMARVGQ